MLPATKLSSPVPNTPSGTIRQDHCIDYQVYGKTDVGLIRQQNEDALLVDEIGGFFAVADGLGGLPEGALASRLAIEELGKRLPKVELKDVALQSMFKDINRKIWSAGRQIHAELGIGTTLTLCVVRGKQLTICHVGDCAVFLFRDKTSRQLTTDHTMEEEFLAQHPGEYVFVPEHFAHTLTRCIGQPGEVECEVTHHTLEEGDRLLLCSDGITKVITEEELLFLALESNHPQNYVDSLIELANKRGGPDNITSIALFWQKDG